MNGKARQQMLFWSLPCNLPNVSISSTTNWSIVSFIHLVNTTWLSFPFYSIKTFMTQVNSNSYLRHFSNVRNAVFAEYIISKARKALLFFAMKFSYDLALFCGTLMSIINVDIHIFFFWIVKTWKIRCAVLYGIPINNLLGGILKIED